MLAVVLALVSAAGFGASDYAAGLATRAASVFQVTLAAQVTSLALALLVVPWVSPFRLSAAAAWWGAAAGVAGIFGAVALYVGFRYAVFSVASTLSAVGSAALSVLAGLLYGERPSTLALAGIALALPAIAAISASPGAADDVRSWHGLAVTGRRLAGVGYGLPPRGPRSFAVATGAAGSVGTMLYFVASHHGLLAVTAVIASLYPGGTILLARIRPGERLGVVRLIGLALAGASVALIAVAGVRRSNSSVSSRTTSSVMRTSSASHRLM